MQDSDLLLGFISVKPSPFKINAGSQISYYPLLPPQPIPRPSSFQPVVPPINVEQIPILRPPVAPPKVSPPKWALWHAEAIDLAGTIEESQNQRKPPPILNELIHSIDSYYGIVYRLKVTENV